MTIINCVLAALVLFAVVSRLARARRHGSGFRARLTCNAWVAAHSLIGTGCFGYIAARCGGVEPQMSMTLLFMGLSLLLLVRWQRRQGDRI